MRIARLPRWLTHRLQRRLAATAAGEPHRLVRYASGTPYLARWYLYPAAAARRADSTRPALYLHGFHASDVGPLHDHPWPSLSVIVSGEYIEHVPASQRRPAGATRALRRCPGDVTLRRAGSPHRVEIPPEQRRPVLTLFAVGRRRRRWGFWCPRGWRDGPRFKRIARERGSPAAGCE